MHFDVEMAENSQVSVRSEPAARLSAATNASIVGMKPKSLLTIIGLTPSAINHGTVAARLATFPGSSRSCGSSMRMAEMPPVCAQTCCQSASTKAER